MTTQERIAQLAQAALRSAPTTNSIPTPATFMPVIEPQRVEPVAPVAAATPAPVAQVAVATMPEATAAPAVVPFKDEPDPELRALLNAQEERQKKKLNRQRRTVNFAILACFLGFGITVAVSPSLRAQCANLLTSLKQTGGDLKTIAGGTKQYDKSLEKIKVRGGQVDEATRAMGIDPTKIKNDDPDMNAEMKQLMGGDGVTTADRNAAVREKFGIVGKLIGGKKDEPAKDTAQH